MCFLDCIRTIRHVISCKYTFFLHTDKVPYRIVAAIMRQEPANSRLRSRELRHAPCRQPEPDTCCAVTKCAPPYGQTGRGRRTTRRQQGTAGNNRGRRGAGYDRKRREKNKERRVAARTDTVQSNAGNASCAGCTGETPATPAESACQRNRSSHGKTAAEPYVPPPYERNPTGAHGS